MTGKPIASIADVFTLYPENAGYWEMATELRWSFEPATVISYISNFVKHDNPRRCYTEFMEFADAALDAKRG